MLTDWGLGAGDWVLGTWDWGTQGPHDQREEPLRCAGFPRCSKWRWGNGALGTGKHLKKYFSQSPISNPQYPIPSTRYPVPNPQSEVIRLQHPSGTSGGRITSVAQPGVLPVG
ncbi:hypothetical protein JYQ62_26540 [Nostoc sp. UHCC 0702]|nr:hypothetical protein JYQ62_26540 [Nostoc sp. UHCC 0702]